MIGNSGNFAIGLQALKFLWLHRVDNREQKTSTLDPIFQGDPKLT